jgi:hypothetical protein
LGSKIHPSRPENNGSHPRDITANKEKPGRTWIRQLPKDLILLNKEDAVLIIPLDHFEGKKKP